MLPCIEYFDDVKRCLYVRKCEKNEKQKSNDVLSDCINIHLNKNESMSTNTSEKKKNAKDSTMWSPHKINDHTDIC
jgi:hypothetical protein